MVDNRGRTDLIVHSPPGLMRLATIVSVDTNLLIAKVKVREPSIGSVQILSAQLPVSYFSAGGGFIGGVPSGGTPCIIAQAEGSSNYYIVCFLAQDPAPRNSLRPTNIIVPPLAEGQLTIQANTEGSINLDSDSITIGEPHNLFAYDTHRKIVINTFDSYYSLTESSRLIEGIIKRDTNPSSNFPSSLRYDSSSYDDTLTIIGMDPIALISNSNDGSQTRNPARIEKREVVYEYQQSAFVDRNDVELKNYIPRSNNNTATATTQFINRREGRVDALSLSLISPNYLIENIKGTVVDLYGNILDLNRSTIPIGDTGLSASDIKHTAIEVNTFNNVYEQIKRYERKSIAYHFEINARKETYGSGPPNVDDASNYARLRSRFYFDVDKEGQFKLNVPASSEMGNVPLLTRYENYSTVVPDPSTKNANNPNGDPNALIFNDNSIDVQIESFINNEVITLLDDKGNNSAPIGNLFNASNPIHIKHGTAYHNIGATCITFQQGTQYIPQEYVPITSLAEGRIAPLPNIVSPTIITAGANANAGGRSGQMNFDGSIEINIGANTVDKQSMWLDTQGGIVAAVGRDIRNVSLAGKLDGQVLLEIGGTTVPAEQPGPNGKTRFDGYSTGLIAGALDIRVYDGQGGMTVFRIDQEGVTMSTLSRLVISANQNIMIHSNAQMILEADHMVIQGRQVMKDANRGEI